MQQIAKPIEYEDELKTPLGAYCSWSLCVIGICGIQRFYLGQPGLGLFMLLTFGFCGIGQLIDLVMLLDAVANANRNTKLLRNKYTYGNENLSTLETPSGSVEELDQLMDQAKDSISKTNHIKF
tara:strand:+ start:232 stop:603 length:372 start_codon:yes stop_codon:yes gene_type:complete